MNITDLIDELQELLDYGELSPDAEVRLAVQPSYPFEHSLASVAVPTADCEECGVEPGCLHEDGCPEGPGLVGGDLEPSEVVYLGEGGQLGYLPGVVSGALGWSER